MHIQPMEYVYVATILGPADYRAPNQQRGLDHTDHGRMSFLKYLDRELGIVDDLSSA